MPNYSSIICKVNEPFAEFNNRMSMTDFFVYFKGP